MEIEDDQYNNWTFKPTTCAGCDFRFGCWTNKAEVCLLKTVFVDGDGLFFDNRCDFTIGDNHIRSKIARELWRLYESQ